MNRLRISKGGNYFLVVIVIMFLPSTFHAEDHLAWSYSFNPCASFKKGSPRKGACRDCQSDVAVSLLATIGN